MYVTGKLRLLLVVVSLDEVGSESIGRLDETAERTDIASRIEIGAGVGAVESQLPSRHVPTDGEHLVVGEGETREEKHDDRLLAVPHGEIGEIAIEAWDILPRAVFSLLALHDGLVDVGLADIVEERRDDDTILGEERLEGGIHGDHGLTEAESDVADIHGMLHKTAVVIEVETRGSGSGEEAEIIEFLDAVVDTVSTCRAEFSLKILT